MAWIESHQTLPQHPKTKRLARLLGVSIPTVIGHLHLLWWWAMDYTEDGMLSRYDADDIADAMQWAGDSRQLIASLVEAGFVDETDGILVIHDWMDYMGRLEDRKAANRRRQEEYRKRQKALREATQELQSGESQARNALHNGDVRVTNTATIPNQTIPNQTATTTRADDPLLEEAADYVLPLFGRVMLKGTEGPQIQTALAQVGHDLGRFKTIVDEVVQRSTQKIHGFGYFVDRFAEEASDQQARAAPRVVAKGRAIAPPKTVSFAEMKARGDLP